MLFIFVFISEESLLERQSNSWGEKGQYKTAGCYNDCSGSKYKSLYRKQKSEVGQI